MKLLGLAAFGLLTVGCLGLVGGGPYPASTATPDMAEATGNGGGGGGGGGGSGGGVGGNGATEDMAKASTAGSDGGMTTTGGSDGGTAAANVAYAGNCTATTPASQSNCAANLLCEQFAGGAEHKCTKPCSPAGGTDTTDCTAPSDGTCTPNGYCKLP
jgi:hypothetical protein